MSYEHLITHQITSGNQNTHRFFAFTHHISKHDATLFSETFFSFYSSSQQHYDEETEWNEMSDRQNLVIDRSTKGATWDEFDW